MSTGVTVSVRSEDVTNPLARFDLSGIPANATIVMAKLGLYSMDAEPCTNMVASSYQLLRPWDAARRHLADSDTKYHLVRSSAPTI